jgi:hypothetical protein
MKCCKHFDKKYEYEGSGKELEKHMVMQDGTVEEKVAYITKECEQRKAIRDKEETQTQEQKPEISKQQDIKQKPDNGQSYGMSF